MDGICENAWSAVIASAHLVLGFAVDGIWESAWIAVVKPAIPGLGVCSGWSMGEGLECSSSFGNTWFGGLQWMAYARMHGVQ